MASYTGAITEYNPYIQQIPDAYAKVGMQREIQYEAGIAETQQVIDKIAGLDIANEGGRAYLQNRVTELTKTLNKYSQVDFSNKNNVTQLQSLARPLYQDENIIADATNTAIYRKWSKDASDAYRSGKMELGQYMRETTDANKWLSSQAAGAAYTGRATPNLATKRELTDRIIKAKKDGLEKNEYVYDKNYSIDTPYYVKSTNKYYSEADFNNFVTNSIMTSRDREMLMNDHWYENQGKPIEQLQREDIAMYQSKIDSNNREIDRIKEMPKLLSGDAKLEYQRTIDDLNTYNQQLKDGKIKYLQTLNLNDPNTADVFHRDLSEARYISSLDILRDEVKKEELQKNEQWFKDKEIAAEMAKLAARSHADAEKAGKAKTPEEQINEVAVFTPVASNAPKTTVDLSTIQRGYKMRNDEINGAMNNLIGKLEENGVNINEYVAGWDQVQVGSKGGATMNIPRFRDENSKRKFYNMVKGIDFAYSMEAADGNLDNKSFRQWVSKVTGYNDNDPNSKFTFGDKMISDALNDLKGTSALLPKLEGLFADKGIVRTLSQIDSAIKDKKDVANVYRTALLQSGALTGDEMNKLRSLTDDQLLDNSYYLDTQQELRRLTAQGKKPIYEARKEKDGSWSAYQVVVGADPDNIINDSLVSGVFSSEMVNKTRPKVIIDQENKLASGFKTEAAARNAINEGGQLQVTAGISQETMKKADKLIRERFSYVQENLNSTVQNLKDDKPSYAAIQDGLTLFLNNSKNQATAEDISIEGGTVDPRILTGISKVEILGASLNNTEDLFNPNPVYEVQFTATAPGDNKDVTKTFNGKISMRSFLATNPSYKNSAYAKYFAPAIYAQKDAYASLKAKVNPLEGSEASYLNRSDINPVYQGVNQEGQTKFYNDVNTDIQWETMPVERDGKQTMISYQVVSLGQNTVLGNRKNKDKNTYQAGAYYVKLKVPTVNGEPKVIFMKKPNKDSYSFNNASDAHYAIRDLIFGNPDVKMDEVDPKTGDINYFTTDPTTLRGIFNAQLSYNGFSELESVKLKDALGNQIVKQQAKQLQFGARQ